MCMWAMLKSSVHFALSASIAVVYRLVGDDVRSRQLNDIAYRRMIHADYSDSVTTRGTIMLIDKLWKSYSHIPLSGSCYMDIVLGLSYRHQPTFNKYRAIMTSNDARAILDVFYVQNEIDEGVYKALLSSKHKLFVELNNYLESVMQEPLNLERLDDPFKKCIFVPVGTTIDKPLKRKAICIRSDGYLKVGKGYTVTGLFLPGWVNLQEEPFMSYKETDFKFDNSITNDDDNKTIIDPLSSTL